MKETEDTQKKEQENTEVREIPVTTRQEVQRIEIRQKQNSFGTVGFVLSVLAILIAAFSAFPLAVVFCLPISLLITALAFIFSFIALFKSPRGMAIAGLVLSVVCVFINIFIAVTISTVMTQLKEGMSNFFHSLLPF